jgi:flagella basal body P-ring formation protein FlgA
MKNLILSAVLVAAPALAAPSAFQDTAALDRAVASFAGHGIGEDGGASTPVDSRLKLASCPMVSMSWHTERHDAVVVTCTGPEWRIFVPMRYAPAPVAPGAGQPAPIPAVAVRLAPVIKRGDPVMIQAGTPGFSITREGVAMGDAAPGGRFLVKCDDAKNPVQAVAVGSGKATLPGWGE